MHTGLLEESLNMKTYSDYPPSVTPFQVCRCLTGSPWWRFDRPRAPVSTSRAVTASTPQSLTWLRASPDSVRIGRLGDGLSRHTRLQGSGDKP